MVLQSLDFPRDFQKVREGIVQPAVFQRDGVAGVVLGADAIEASNSPVIWKPVTCSRPSPSSTSVLKTAADGKDR